ncbi:alpha/beta knot, partial [Backusella circina FSU 941]
FEFPALFKRIKSQQNNIAKHWISLREKKQYRNEHKAVIVQGFKTIKELRDLNVPLKSLAVTAKLTPKDASEIQGPAASILRQPDIFPSKHYYLTDIDLTRRILGTHSKPGNHDIFAEVPFPKVEFPKDNIDKWLVLDRINDPGNMGTLIRTARALGWNAGLISSTSCDVYNDKVIRASRALSLTWPHLNMPSDKLIGYLKDNDITPIIADMMPHGDNDTNTWTMENNGLRFWWDNKDNANKKVALPKKIALVLSSEHGGVKGLNNELRVSIPMFHQVESLNVAIAGAILMSELNRL